MGQLDIKIPLVPDQQIADAFQHALDQSEPYAPGELETLVADIKRMLKEQDAVLVAHYYTSDDLQKLAEETGGCVADSLEMARFGSQHSAKTLIVAGVRFMGETAKILNPEKRVLMPDLKAECSLDLNCPVELFKKFREENPDYTAVVYANTSAAVKAESDWVVTSGIALDIVKHLAEKGEKVLWAPDKHLGSYIQRETGIEMLLWPGSCVVHEKFRADALRELKQQYPQAKVLVHPESPDDVVAMADVIGSTTGLINAARELDADTFIVATEPGIFYKMRQAAPDKTFLEAPQRGEGATCESCERCPWMGMNGLRNLAEVLRTGKNEIHVDEEIRRRAVVPIQRMLDFAEQQKELNKAGA